MYIDELIGLFEGAAGAFPGFSSPALSDELRAELTARKYDVQDQAFIEVILKDDASDLAGSFTEAFGKAAGKFAEGAERQEFLASEGAKKEAIRIFIASLEHLINFYHSSLIGKHFSST